MEPVENDDTLATPGDVMEPVERTEGIRAVEVDPITHAQLRRANGEKIDVTVIVLFERPSPQSPQRSSAWLFITALVTSVALIAGAGLLAVNGPTTVVLGTFFLALPGIVIGLYQILS